MGTSSQDVIAAVDRIGTSMRIRLTRIGLERLDLDAQNTKADGVGTSTMHHYACRINL